MQHIRATAGAINASFWERATQSHKGPRPHVATRGSNRTDGRGVVIKNPAQPPLRLTYHSYDYTEKPPQSSTGSTGPGQFYQTHVQEWPRGRLNFFLAELKSEKERLWYHLIFAGQQYQAVNSAGTWPGHAHVKYGKHLRILLTSRNSTLYINIPDSHCFESEDLFCSDLVTKFFEKENTYNTL